MLCVVDKQIIVIDLSDNFIYNLTQQIQLQNILKTMHSLDLKSRNRQSLRNHIYNRGQQNSNILAEVPKSESKGKAIKINAKKLPADFFTTRKNRIHYTTASQKNSARTSKERNVSQYASTIPLAPSLIANSVTSALQRKKHYFQQAASIQLEPHYCDFGTIPLRKMNSETKAHQHTNRNHKIKKENSFVEPGYSQPIIFNQFEDAQDLFNCTFAKKFHNAAPSTEATNSVSQKVITQKSPKPQHETVERKRVAKTGQQRRISRHIFQMIDIQKKMTKKVNQFENIGKDLQLVLNKKLYGERRICEQICTSRDHVELRTVTLPPIQSARCKA